MLNNTGSVHCHFISDLFNCHVWPNHLNFLNCDPMDVDVCSYKKEVSKNNRTADTHDAFIRHHLQESQISVIDLIVHSFIFISWLIL